MTDDELQQENEERSRAIQQAGSAVDQRWLAAERAHQVAMRKATPDGVAWPVALMLGLALAVLAGVVGVRIGTAEAEAACLRQAVGK